MHAFSQIHHGLFALAMGRRPRSKLHFIHEIQYGKHTGNRSLVSNDEISIPLAKDLRAGQFRCNPDSLAKKPYLPGPIPARMALNVQPWKQTVC